jgi:hypothetical protein
MPLKAKPAARTPIRARSLETPAEFGGLKPAFRTNLGALFIGDCLPIVRAIPDSSLDLVITSPPYDGQSKYGNPSRHLGV